MDNLALSRFLQRFREYGVQFVIEDGVLLAVGAPRESVPPDMLAALREHRGQVSAYLKSRRCEVCGGTEGVGSTAKCSACAAGRVPLAKSARPQPKRLAA